MNAERTAARRWARLARACAALALLLSAAAAAEESASQTAPSKAPNPTTNAAANATPNANANATTTPTPNPNATPTANATPTSTPTSNPNPTATPNLASTATPPDPARSAADRAAAGVASRLAKERTAAAQLAGREVTLLGRLAEAERQVEMETRALRAVQAKLRAAVARQAASEVRAQAAEAEVARAAAAVEPRLFARYRLGREGYVRFLLGATSLGDVLRRRRLFDAVLSADFDALAELRLRAQAARAARDERAFARAEAEQGAAAEKERRAALEERVEQQKHLLASVQKEKALHEQAVRELSEAARALSEKLAQMQSSPRAPVERGTGSPASQRQGDAPELPMRKLRGKLPFPVESGRVEVRFGRAVDRQFGTVTLQHGIDVRCPAGAAVRAIHAGRVVHAGWFRGYGNLVILNHGDGLFSLMAHLATLERGVGDEVWRGDAVGTVGDTGSLKGPYLYFELRDGQKPLDPSHWLAPPPSDSALLAGKASEAP